MSELKKSPAWEDLTFANNFLFCKILENDPELCRQILEMLLDIEIEKLEPVQVERTMFETMDSKSVRFDVYAKDGNRIFDIEIKLNDRAYKVFYIASEYGKMKSDEVKCFFKFLAKQRAESGLTKSIEEKVNFAKKDMTWRKEYMTWQQTIDEEKEIAFEEGKEEGREEGIERGKSEKAIEAAENLLREGDLPEKVARCIGLPLEKVQELAKRVCIKA